MKKPFPTNQVIKHSILVLPGFLTALLLFIGNPLSVGAFISLTFFSLGIIWTALYLIFGDDKRLSPVACMIISVVRYALYGAGYASLFFSFPDTESTARLVYLIASAGCIASAAFFFIELFFVRVFAKSKDMWDTSMEDLDAETIGKSKGDFDQSNVIDVEVEDKC